MDGLCVLTTQGFLIYIKVLYRILTQNLSYCPIKHVLSTGHLKRTRSVFYNVEPVTSTSQKSPEIT